MDLDELEREVEITLDPNELPEPLRRTPVREAEPVPEEVPA